MAKKNKIIWSVKKADDPNKIPDRSVQVSDSDTNQPEIKDTNPEVNNTTPSDTTSNGKDNNPDHIINTPDTPNHATSSNDVPVALGDTSEPGQNAKVKTLTPCESCGTPAELTLRYNKILMCEDCWSQEQTATEERNKQKLENPDYQICKCGHNKGKHDSHGICDENNCDCIEFRQLTFTINPETGEPILPIEVIKERIPSILRPRHSSPLLEQETLKLKVDLMEIGSIIPNSDKNPSAPPKYMDVDLDKMADIREDETLSPEEKYKALTDDELTLEELARDYGTNKSEVEMWHETILRTTKVVETSTITEIQDKIKELQRIGKIRDAMEQGCREVLKKKSKEETREAREKRLKEETERKEKDKAEGKTRFSGRDGRGAKRIKKAQTGPGARQTQREKFIANAMRGGITREMAEKMYDSD